MFPCFSFSSSLLLFVFFSFQFFYSLPPCSSVFFFSSCFFLFFLLLFGFSSSLPPPSLRFLPTTYQPHPPSLHRQSSRDLERLELERGSSSCGCGAGVGAAGARAGPTRPRDPRAREEVRCLLVFLSFLFVLFKEGNAAL